MISSVAMSWDTLALPPSESGRSRAQCVTYDRRSLAASDRKDAFHVRACGAQRRNDDGRPDEVSKKFPTKSARQDGKLDIRMRRDLEIGKEGGGL